MKKTTKKLISSLLATSMLFSSVYVSPVMATEADYVEEYEEVEEYSEAFDLSSIVDLMAASVTFDATTLSAAADKEALAQSDLPTGVTLVGSATKRTSKTDGSVTSIELAKDGGGGLTVALDAGDTVTAVVSSTGGTNTSAYVFQTGGENVGTVQEVTGAGTAKTEYTITAETAGDYTLVSPKSDYNRGIRVYSLVVVPAGEESTSESTSETTTETTTTTTTETTTTTTETTTTTTETTTTTTESTTKAAPVESTTESTTKVAPVESTTETTTAAPVTETQSETTTETIVPAPAGKYTFVASDKAENVSNGGILFENSKFVVTAKQLLKYTDLTATPDTVGDNLYTGRYASGGVNTETTLDGVANTAYRVAFAIEAKSAGKAAIDCKVNAGKLAAVATGSPETGFTSVAVQDSTALTDDAFYTLTFDMVAGETYYFMGKGTNVPFHGINLVAEFAPVDYSFIATDKAENVSNGGVLFENSAFVVTAQQLLKYTDLAAAPDTVGDKTYTGRFASGGVNTETTLDGVANTAYRVAFAIEAKVDGKGTIDCKVNAGKLAAIATGSPETGFTSVAVQDSTALTEDAFYSIPFEMKKGETYYFIGKGTNVPFHCINLTALSEPEEESTEATTVDYTLHVGVSPEAATEATTEGAPDVIIAEVGAPVDFNVYVANVANAPFNNYTFYVTYDPAVVKVIETVAGTADAAAAAENIKVVEEGKLKVAKYLDKDVSAAKDGTLLTIKCEVVGAGNPAFTIVPVENTGFMPIVAPGAKPVEVTMDKNDVVIEVPVKEAVSASVKVDGVDVVDGKQTVADAKVGDKIKVIIDLAAGGFNNYTFNLLYNPKVLKAVGVVAPADLAAYATYKDAALYDEAVVTKSMTFVPSAENADYKELGADGVKTVAELGKLIFANVLGMDPTAVADKGGTFIVLEFEVVGGGESDLKIEYKEKGFWGVPGGAEITVEEPTNVVVDVQAEVLDYVTGDVDCSGMVDSTDASMLCEYVINSDTKLPCQEKYPNNWDRIANVDGNRYSNGAPKYDSNDLAMICQRAYTSDIIFPIDVMIENGTY